MCRDDGEELNIEEILVLMLGDPGYILLMTDQLVRVEGNDDIQVEQHINLKNI